MPTVWILEIVKYRIKRKRDCFVFVHLKNIISVLIIDMSVNLNNLVQLHPSAVSFGYELLLPFVRTLRNTD